MMLQKIFNLRSNNIKYLSVFLLFILILIVFVNPVFAAGLTPPTPTTEPYQSDDLSQNPIILWVNFFINWISVIIVVGSIIMIAAAGLQYSAARDNSQGVQDAKKKIGSVVTALLAYFFLYAFLQWLVPGGAF